MMHVFFHRQAKLILGLLIAGVITTAAAQVFNSNVYYEQCLRFEAAGDYATARQSCLNALELNGDSVDAKLALARVELALGNYAAAEAGLNDVRNETTSAEVYILLAEVALATDRSQEAEAHLVTARGRLDEALNTELDSRLNFLEGRIDEARHNFPEAIAKYRNAIDTNPFDTRYYMALADLQFRLGNLAAARTELEGYQRFTSNTRNPALLSLLGNIKWAQSDLPGAVSDLEKAVILRGRGNSQAQQSDLRSLAFVYYGQGDTRAGGLALRAATDRGNLIQYWLNRGLLWLGLLIIVIGIHLVGESRIPSSNAVSVAESPALWSLGNVYGTLFLSLLISLAAAVAYSIVRYDNYLAIVTPLQSADVRALFFACLGLLLFLLTLLRAGRNGFDPAEILLGGADKIPMGLGLGVLFLALTLAYRYYAPQAQLDALQGFYLDFSRITPALIAAAVLVPLSEVFFRPFAYKPLERRYSEVFAVLISGALSALVFGAPILLLLAFGLALAEVFRRTSSGLMPLVAQLVLHLGLVIGVAFIPFVRGLFF